MLSIVRTTVTLDADAEAIVRRMMSDRGVSFKRALNDAIRAGSTPAPRQPRAATRARSMGQPRVSLDHALRAAGELEDDELARRMQVGK